MPASWNVFPYNFCYLAMGTYSFPLSGTLKKYRHVDLIQVFHFIVSISKINCGESFSFDLSNNMLKMFKITGCDFE